jgi:hypothetical protein
MLSRSTAQPLSRSTAQPLNRVTAQLGMFLLANEYVKICKTKNPTVKRVL